MADRGFEKQRVCRNQTDRKTLKYSSCEGTFTMCVCVCVCRSSGCESLFSLIQNFLWDSRIVLTLKPTGPVVHSDIMSLTLRSVPMCVWTRDRAEIQDVCMSDSTDRVCVCVYQVSLQRLSVALWAVWGSRCQVQWRFLSTGRKQKKSEGDDRNSFTCHTGLSGGNLIELCYNTLQLSDIYRQYSNYPNLSLCFKYSQFVPQLLQST